MQKRLIYAGIGSRETPAPILRSMELIGQQLAPNWLLRSGYAEGADQAFGRGCEAAQGQGVNGEFQMFLPWGTFNNAPLDDPRFIVPTWTPELLQIACDAHPAWDRLTCPVKLLMARNVCQVLGEDLQTPATMVVCYTPRGTGGGGTGQAIRIARRFNIPVFDLALEQDQKGLVDFVDLLEKSQN